MPVICPDCFNENTKDSTFCKACGTSIEPAETRSSLTRTILAPQSSSKEEKLFAGRYQILSTLGRGGMGDVYKVRDTKLQEEMALKVLRPEIASDPDIIQRFRNELKLARKITHKNVCRVFDFHEEGGTPFITMEYLEGEDLKSLIKNKGKLEEVEAVGIATQIVEGLAEAHTLGVVHRDLKPQNIMIEPTGRAKIMDFGIARSLHSSGMTQTGQMIGTPDYISSEQAAGQPADHRADIYALGVILYEMTTGKLPFQGDTALSVITKHRETKAKNPRDINPEISEGLGRLILRCMEKDRELRYQSSFELLEDLHGLSEGIAPKPVPRTARSGLSGGRKWIGVIGAAALVFIAAILFLWQKQSHRASPPPEMDRPSLAIVYFENNTGDETLSHWRKGFAELFTTVLAQSKYMNVLSGDRVYKILSDLDQLGESGYSSDVLKQVAEMGKVRHVLRGSYIKAGPLFRVSISLQDMETGELVGSQTAEAEGEENLFALVDDLTQKIKTDLNFTTEQIENDFDKASAEVMTSSPEAYKLFVEGLRHHYRADFKLCIEFMDKAIAIDPEFAAAYGWKAWAYDSTGYHSEFVTAMTKAFELSHKVTERERYKMTAYYYMRVAMDIAKAKEELERFVRLYPEDMYANHQLGYLYFHAFEEYEKSAQYLRRNVENRIEMFYSYYMLASAEMSLGNYDRARDVCEAYISDKGDHPEIRFNLSINYFCRGDYDRAFSEVEKAVELGFTGSFWNDMLKGAILQVAGDVSGAEGHYRDMVGSRDVLIGAIGREYLGELALLQGRFKEANAQVSQAVNLLEAAGDEASLSRLYILLAYIGLQKGEYEAALKACDKALQHSDSSVDAFNVSMMALHIKGLSRLALNGSIEARKIAQELKVQAEQGASRYSLRDYFHLMGSIEMNEGNTEGALKYFENSVALMPAQNQDDLWFFKETMRRTFFLFSLAQAYFRAEDMEKAQQTFETLTSLTIGRSHWGDLYVRALYWLGQIGEKQSRTDAAAAHYQKFLELWNDADPGRPEVADARERVAGLR